MKTAQLPPVRVTPAVREQIESVLHEGESLTQFVEKHVGIGPSAAPHADWDGKRFFTLGALRLHLEWSGTSWDTWARQHPRAVLRLPF